MRLFLHIMVSVACLAAAYRGQAQVPDTVAPPIMNDVGFDQKLNTQLPLDLPFTDELGRAVKLGDFYHHDKPVVLSFVYYECPMLCTLVLNGMVDSFKQIPFNPGKEYEVVTVSFDPGETADLAAKKKATYMDALDKPGAEAGWHFLTGTSNAIAQLTRAVGFRFAYDEKSDEYAHASGIMVTTPEGKLSHYLYGIDYPPRDMRLSLVTASKGKIGSPVDQLLLFCYHYDPLTGKYSAAIMNIVRVGCFIVIFAVVLFVARMLRRDARAARAKRHQEAKAKA